VFVPSSELGQPTPQASVFPPWSQREEEQHSLAGEGVVGGPVRTSGKKAWPSVYSVMVRGHKEMSSILTDQ
jgi:hypothetical protein